LLSKAESIPQHKPVGVIERIARIGLDGRRILESMAYRKRLDADLLEAALAGYQHQYAVLGERIAEITRELGGKAGRSELGAAGAPAKRVVSADTRRRMAEAQQRRWSKRSGKKRNMSSEGRERIAEATRKRWEAYRAQKAAEAR
jgi:hypothetical protein